MAETSSVRSQLSTSLTIRTVSVGLNDIGLRKDL